MCLLCDLLNTTTQATEDTKPELDMRQASVAYAVRVLGKEETEAAILNQTGKTPPELFKSAALFAKRVHEAGLKMGLSFPKFLAESKASTQNQQSKRYDFAPSTSFEQRVAEQLAKQGLTGTPPKTSTQFLDNAKQLQQSRASQYDQPEGERSIAKTVAAFNTITGHELSETDAWLMMTLLKVVRANQGDFKSDNYEDLVSYAALLAESAVKEQG